jgi:pilus assembly protein CpaB
MKPKTLVLMILAVVCGLVASYMTSQLIAQNKEQVTVLKAKSKITQWTTIKSPADMFEPITKPKKEAHASAVFADAKDEWKENLKNRRLRANIEAGDELTEEHLLKKDVSGIDTMLDKGKRAMSVSISADKAVGFFVVPGSKVDVIQTVAGVANVLLENVLVLAIDLSTSRPEDKAGMVGGTATLQLENNEQVLKLAGARDRGTISLVMRPPGDDSKSEGDSKQAMLPIAPPPPPILDDEPKSDPKGNVVTTPGSTRTKVAQTRYMDIMNGSQFFRVEATKDDNGVMQYKILSYDEVMNVARERQERRSTPPPAPPAPDEGVKKSESQ